MPTYRIIPIDKENTSFFTIKYKNKGPHVKRCCSVYHQGSLYPLVTLSSLPGPDSLAKVGSRL
ncbi:hypothetical protein DPMN_011684 [Dreissena polymorpha]|uniref:Uncharacterized protein n=1 Tax=Dreissena polymorpha TaxID=45954 RepID=A0A9D4N4H0_DREPO|nr:hypothetical protein DPMN_011684 [Dreissena polymorpha]